ncbi:hypothetical protein IC229_25580 [Spirosoma sp. BT702]|uniref:Uncharacterized protein n=1 Tax=Spirosoma profusum TaxID=2771354 RepID=A0A926Y3G0_9BACT|nr:hypothetical protein [Spirosoma profusum]MBD2704042.1 hypothetical protein [Spirosoma profusum]
MEKKPLAKGEFGIVDASTLIPDIKKTNLRFELINDQLVMHLSLTFNKNDNVIVGDGRDDYPTPIGVFKIGDSNHFTGEKITDFILYTGTEPGEVRIFPANLLRLDTDGEKREHGESFASELEQLKAENRRLREILSNLISGK